MAPRSLLAQRHVCSRQMLLEGVHMGCICPGCAACMLLLFDFYALRDAVRTDS
jgi:hypothetical protein